MHGDHHGSRCYNKKVTTGTGTNSVSDSPAKQTEKHETVLNTANRTEKTKTRTKKLGKAKGAHTKNRTKIRTAIINGEEIDYKNMKAKHKVGKDLISSVIKELAGKGLIQKSGRKWERVA